MTSVPNRQLRLSGNNALVASPFSTFLFLLLVAIAFSSCGIFRKTPTGPPVSETPPTKEIEVPSPTEAPAPAKPDVIKITYMLPFNTDAIPFDSAGNVTRKLSDQSRISLDYYRGAVMALDTVQKNGVRLKAFVYDTAEDTSKVRRLFDNPDVQQSHLIIGPVYPAQLQTAAPLARKNKVSMLSPFSTVNDFVERNPYYILANSSLSAHCELLYDYLIEQHHPQQIVLIYNTSDEAEKQYAQNFIDRETRMLNGTQFISVTDSSEITYNDIDQILEKEGNVVIIPSVNESFVNSMVRKLAALVDTYPVTLYGMPQWRDFKNISAYTFDKLNTRVTASMWFDKTDPAIMDFMNRYSAKYNAAASEYALEGYNQTLFFVSFIAAKGNNFDNLLPEYSMVTAGETFRFKTMRRKPLHHTESTNMPPYDFIENRSVHVLEFKGGKLVKIK